ncbi:hypothetical protein K466DRAFT_595018 [Polyporus arcularius HHB13444]|uniref:Uncharacterized protein n=1 Tax=Polyporus arcularius HHB13444 TaxID=1314778 RepID=A0A5C3PVM5_9APHY|nr:hypothetical protein K466DRAFT_595018 [Polyporus arcularius HHB13444]
MAETAKAFAPANLFAAQDASKHLYADRILTATRAFYWVWPIKKFIPAYQVHKGRSYQYEGQVILERAEQSDPRFKEGPAESLRQEQTRVVQDLQDMYQNPELISVTASRRYKRRARRTRNNIVVSSEAFGAMGTYRIPGGARDDTGMPLSITTVITASTSQERPPMHPIIEPRAPASEGHLLPRLEGPKTDPTPAVQDTIAWQLAQLSIPQEVPEESAALPEGSDDEPLCPGPSSAVPVAA